MATETVMLKDVRLANGYLFKPYNKPNDRGEMKYRGTFLFEPGSEMDKLCQAAVMKTAEEEFGPNWKTILGAMESSKKCLRKGDTALDKSGNIREGFAGMKYVSSSNATQPLVIGGKKNPQTGKFDPLPPGGGKPYNGCYVNAKIEIVAMKAFENAPNNIYAKVLTVQYLRDAQAFAGGGAPPSADGFDEVEGAEAATVGSDDPMGDNNDDLGI